MARPTDLAGAGMGVLPGIARMELMAVLEREYRRELDPDVTGGLHHIAAQWNREMNQGRPMTADDPFAADFTFEQNYRRQFPQEAQRIDEAVTQMRHNREAMAVAQPRANHRAMDEMDALNMAAAFGNPLGRQRPAEPTAVGAIMDRLAVDQARGRDQTAMTRLARDGTVAHRINIDHLGVPAVDPLTYEDIHAVHDAMGPANDSWQPYKQMGYDFQETMANFLVDKHDIATWMDQLSEKLGTNMEETTEIAIRMAMEVSFKENEAKIAGLNKKLQDMEGGRN